MGNLEGQPPLSSESEERQGTADRVFSLLDKNYARYDFLNRKDRQEFIRNLDFKNFKEFLINLNGVIRSQPVESFDGHNVELVGWAGGAVPPTYKDKEPLLREAWLAAKSMNDTDDVALMLSTVVCAVHPFADGNGRVSRILYCLLHDNHDSRVQQVNHIGRLSTLDAKYEAGMGVRELSGGFDAVVKEEFTGISLIDLMHAKDPVQPSRLQVLESRSVKPEDRQWFSANTILSVDDKKRLAKVIDDSEDRFSAVYRHLADTGQLKDNYVEQGDGFSLLLWNRIALKLTHEDVDGIVKHYFAVKKLRVQKIIDLFVHPRAYLMPDGSTIKDEIAKGVRSANLD